MTNPYTKITAHRLLPFAKLILTIRILRNCIQVTYIANGGKCSTFLSKKAFTVSHLNARNIGSLEIEVIERHGNAFTVLSHTSNTYYVARPGHPNERERCECGDVKFRGTRCKHQIAVINRINARAKIRAEQMPEGFGFMPLVLHPIQPAEIYYKNQQIQIWKLHRSQWGTYGHLLLVDTNINVAVAGIQGSYEGCWQELEAKRTQYIKQLQSVAV
jgi:hypothetical protein